MMHIGAIVGGSLPSALPWQEYQNDHERRDMAAAGFGAGLTVAFGAPIGMSMSHFTALTISITTYKLINHFQNLKNKVVMTMLNNTTTF